MKRVLLIVSIAVLAVACPKKEEPNTATTATTAPSTATQATATSAPAPVPAPATPAPATPSAGALATQETNWKGIVAEVTEFRRKGNTLTAKVRLSNHGSEETKAEVLFKEVYLIDTAGGKKYEVLRDEKGTFISSLTPGWNDRWYDSHLKPGDSYLLWMKFPAPPAEIRAITLQIPSTPPFEDINIQD